MKFDESFCPEDCERELYDLAFTLRSQRYVFVIEQGEEQKQLDAFTKELTEQGKNLKSAQTNLEKDEQELENYQREKQRRLNQVKGLVILKLNQMQHYNKDTKEFELLKDSIVITNKEIGSLVARVGELKKETEAQLEKHKKNQTHLHRMRVDCEYMERVIKSLNENIKEALIRKFGSEVNLDELEEAILKQLIAEFKTPVSDLVRTKELEIYKLQEQVQKKKNDLAGVIQENTEKLHLLSILEEEKLKIEEILRLQKLKPETIDFEKENEYLSDIEKLTQIKKLQEEQIEAMKDEIKVLSWKIPPLPRIAEHKKGRTPYSHSFGTSEGGSKRADVSEDSRGLIDTFKEIVHVLPVELEQSVPEKLDAEGVRRILHDIKHTLEVEKPSSQAADILKQVADDLLGKADESKPDTTTKELLKDIIYETLEIKVSDEKPGSGQEVIADAIESVATSLGPSHTTVMKDVLHEVAAKHSAREEFIEEIMHGVLHDSVTSHVTRHVSGMVMELTERVVQKQILQQQLPKIKLEEALLKAKEKIKAAVSTELPQGVKKIILKIMDDFDLKMQSLHSDVATVTEVIDIFLDETLCKTADAKDILQIRDIFSNIIVSTLEDIHNSGVQETSADASEDKGTT